MWDGRPLRLVALVAVVCAAALVLLIGVLASSDWRQLELDPATYVVLSLLILTGELLPIVVPRVDTEDEITVSTTFALALLLVGPLGLAMLVQTLAVAVQDLRARKGLAKLAYNMAQYVLTMVAARVAYIAVAGGSLTWGEPLRMPKDLPGVLLAAMVFFAVNSGLVGLVTAYATGTGLRTALFGHLPFQLGTYGVLLAFVPVIAVAENVSLWLVPLLLLPVGMISANARLAARREHEALHDPLTRLPNRTLFQRRTRRALVEAERGASRAAVVLIDLDHFREINDTLGHTVGDDLLAQVGRRLLARGREGDIVSRLGGDEFAVLVPALGAASDGVAVAQRLMLQLRDPFTVDGVRLDVPASIGVSLFPEHGHDVDTLLQRADIALYAAKVERSSVRVYEAVNDVHSPQRLALATQLRDGLQRDELFMEYQPQVLGGSGRVCGFEALARWRHPTRGILMPDEFLPLVENTGLIVPMTLVVLSKALGELACWRAGGHDVTVAVNLSARHLLDLDLPQQVARLLAEHGLPASALVLEITETVVMAEPARAIAILAALRALGLSVSVDDFGTGYSSLTYLRQLDVDELKIDKSFVLNLAADADDRVIVRSTVELGHSLGLHIVAEGVEDEVALSLLRAWGCDVLQGFHISRPLPAERVLPWLALYAASPATRPG